MVLYLVSNWPETGVKTETARQNKRRNDGDIKQKYCDVLIVIHFSRKDKNVIRSSLPDSQSYKIFKQTIL